MVRGLLIRVRRSATVYRRLREVEGQTSRDRGRRAGRRHIGGWVDVAVEAHAIKRRLINFAGFSTRREDAGLGLRVII